MNEVLNCYCCGAEPEIRNDGGFVTVYHQSDDCWVIAESVSLCEWNRRVDERTPARPKPNPALENVLAKLRPVSALYPESSDDCTMCHDVTLGDLRRWVESEGKQ